VGDVFVGGTAADIGVQLVGHREDVVHGGQVREVPVSSASLEMGSWLGLVSFF